MRQFNVGALFQKVFLLDMTEKTPRSILFGVLAVAIVTGIPAVLHSQWMWLDDQVIVGGMLWPPNNLVNESFHRMGRELSAHGAYFKFLSLFLPLNAVAYCLVNFAIHLLTIAMLTSVTWIATRQRIPTLIAGVLAAFASTGPEVFLTLFKTEGRMMLFVAAFLFLFARWRSTGQRPFATTAGMIVSIAASGILGKETFIVLFIGGLGAVLLFYLIKFRLSGLQAIAAASLCLITGTGAALVVAFRYGVGTAGVMQGAYAGTLFHPIPSFSKVNDGLFTYSFGTSDVIVVLVLASLTLLRILFGKVRPLSETPWLAVGLFSYGGALAVFLFYIGFIDYKQVYYMYPVGLLAAVSLACFYFGLSELTAPGLIRPAVIFLALLAFVLSIPEYLNRVYANSKVANVEHELMNTIASLPEHSLVLVPFTSANEQLSNLPILMRYVWNRTDLEFVSWTAAGTAKRIQLAKEQQRAIALFTIYEAGENWEIGGRGLMKDDRATSFRKLKELGFDVGKPLLSHRTRPQLLYIPPRLSAFWGLRTGPFIHFTLFWDVYLLNFPEAHQ